MYVSRLALQNWRNFKQAEGAFGARTFIIGPNASGKSNLLDALRFLRDVAAIGLRQSVLDKRGGVSALRCLAATYRSDVQIEVTLVEDDGPDAGAGWRYRLAFNKDHRQEQPVIRCERVWHGEELLVERPNEEDRSDPERLTQTYLEQINANRGFRELAEFFRSIAYRHPVPEVIRDPKGFSSAPVINDPYGRDFLQRLWQTPQRTREARLRRINQVLQVAVPQFRELRVEQDETGTPHLVGLYEHWRPNAARQSEAQFRMARCVCSVCCGRCSKTAGRCCSKNRNCPCTQPSSRSCRGCSSVRAGARAGAGKSLSRRIPRICCVTQASRPRKCSGCDRPHRAR